jgi:hypothetical protein
MRLKDLSLQAAMRFVAAASDHTAAMPVGLSLLAICKHGVVGRGTP